MLIVAFIALRNPKQTSTAAGTATVTHSVPASASAPSAPSSAPRTSSPPKSPSTHAASSAPKPTKTSAVGSLPLVVVNDTTTPNLARDAAQRFEGGGWNVTTYDESFQNNIASTAAYYDPDVSGAQQAALALQKQYPTIKRVAPRFAPAAGGDPLPDGPVVVVLTSDYSTG